MRDRLIELLKEYHAHPEKSCPRLGTLDSCSGCKYDKGAECDQDGRFADHLLANGVIVQAHGEWKKFQELYPRYVCTCCNHLYNNKSYKYCPNCGARMERSNENAD